MTPARKRDADRRAELESLRASLERAMKKSKAQKKKKTAEVQKAPEVQPAAKKRAPRKATKKSAKRPVDEQYGDFDVQVDEELSGRWWERDDPGGPRPVVGGLAARTRKGPIGATWWSRRFLGSLESVMVGGRMARGRSYARKGQIVDLRIGPGVVAAVVQGSREEPYAVSLRMPVVNGEDWDRILAALAGRAAYSARMLAGDLPHEVEEVFESEGCSLLPAPHARLVTECTCPDWENPCKHIAAVCYLLAEEFDRDAFSLLAWRGREKEDVLAELRARRREAAGASSSTLPAGEAGSDGTGDADAAAVADVAAVVDVAASAAALSAGEAGDDRELVARYWEPGPELAQVRILPETAAVPTVALRLAPRGTITVRGGDLVDVLGPWYRQITAAAAARARE